MQIKIYIFFLSIFYKIPRIERMRKVFAFLIVSLFTGASFAATVAASDFMGTQAYQNLYPYMNNKMRVSLNSGTDTTNSRDTVSVLARTSNLSGGTRRVVARSANSSGGISARSATVGQTNSGVTARSASTQTSYENSDISYTNARSAATSNRRVVARRGSSDIDTVSRASRLNGSYVYKTTQAAETDAASSTTESISTARCLADYVTCMNGYCERDTTSYNRCYCSSKLAQIDAEYQPEIDSLTKQIIVLKNEGTYTDAEMQEYWEEKVGQYTGDDSWTKLDNALDIDWSDTESRVRGQQAFLTGHEYCIQHLQACSYMSANMRDAYVSQINRDCATYKTSLQTVKDAAESIIENLSD